MHIFSICCFRMMLLPLGALTQFYHFFMKRLNNTDLKIYDLHFFRCLRANYHIIFVALLILSLF